MTNEWPFIAAEALAAESMTFRELRGLHRGEYPGIWVPRGVDLDLRQQARSAWLWSRRKGVVSGVYASALLGAKWVDTDQPVELIHANRRPPPGIIVHSDTLRPGEICAVDGLPVTSVARTAYDLGRHLSVDDAVIRIDALMNATGLGVGHVEYVIDRHPGVRGLRRLQETLALVDGGAESPYESLTRLLLIRAGFPPVTTQIKVLDDWGGVFARIDMGWPQYRVGVDFEGAHHWSDPRQRSWDVERYAQLPHYGWIDERLTSGIFHNRPQSFLDRVGAALLSRGCPKTW
jgi:hypothetical protein